MSYRKKYEKYLGIKLTLEFEVHHIDHDRNNNDFGNLVAIPKDMHRRYHEYCGYYQREKEMRDLYNDNNEMQKKINISSEINEIQEIANEYGFHSVKMMYKLQDLANKAIRPIESQSSYESYDKSCKFLLKEIANFSNTIKGYKAEQDKIAQKLLVNY